jgi:hypothetical protein
MTMRGVGPKPIKDASESRWHVIGSRDLGYNIVFVIR